MMDDLFLRLLTSGEGNLMSLFGLVLIFGLWLFIRANNRIWQQYITDNKLRNQQHLLLNQQYTALIHKLNTLERRFDKLQHENSDLKQALLKYQMGSKMLARRLTHEEQQRAELAIRVKLLETALRRLLSNGIIKNEDLDTSELEAING